MVSRKNSWSSLSAISIAILLSSTSRTAILARIWASRNFCPGAFGPASGVASRAVGALARDPDETARQLTAWLTGVAGLDDVCVGAIEIPAATGFSNETVLFDATWADGAEAHRLVVRIAPQAYQVFFETNFESQFRVMDALGDHSDVPIPTMLWFEADPAWFGSPFWIMERVDGQVPSDAPHYATAGWLHDSSPAEQAQAWWSGIEAMAAVHRVDWRAAGLDFLADPSRGATGLEQQLQYYEEYLEWAEDEGPHPGARAALGVVACRDARSTAAGRRTRVGRLTTEQPDATSTTASWRCSTGRWSRSVIRGSTSGWWLFCDETLSTGSGFPTSSRVPDA